MPKWWRSKTQTVWIRSPKKLHQYRNLFFFSIADQENCFDIKTRWKTKHRFSAATPEEQKSYINDLASIITALSKSPATSPAQAKEKPHKNLIPHQLHIPLDVLLFSKKVVEKDKDEKDLEKKRAAKRGISTTFEWSVENNHDEHFLDGILAQLPTGTDHTLFHHHRHHHDHQFYHPMTSISCRYHRYHH